MFGNKMNLDMEKYMPTGLYLNMEEQLTLQVSLPALQQENRFSSVAIYAKILGSSNDYYIAYGRGKDFIRNKMFFYSLYGQFWRVLFPPTTDDIADFRFTRNLFTGNPTHVHRFHLGNKKIAIREETRLSAAVHLLDWETSIGPRGALQIDPRTRMVKENPHFEGIEDAAILSSYVHHRLPKDRERFAATQKLCQAAGDACLEFLEPIEMDYPPVAVDSGLDEAHTWHWLRCKSCSWATPENSGSWMLQNDPVSDMVRLHSLWWPGHTFYYCKNSGKFGSLYIGLGDRNDDLPFMLSL